MYLRTELNGVGCPRCYRFIDVPPGTASVVCPHCTHELAVSALAERLLTAYSTPALGNRADAALAHGLLRHTAEYGWGDGMHIGGKDWLHLGFPLTDDDFARVVMDGQSIALDSLQRLFCEFTTEVELPRTALAIADRLRSEQNRWCRECLYRVAARPPLRDRILRAALEEALCKEEEGTIALKCCRVALDQQLDERNTSE